MLQQKIMQIHSKYTIKSCEELENKLQEKLIGSEDGLENNFSDLTRTMSTNLRTYVYNKINNLNLVLSNDQVSNLVENWNYRKNKRNINEINKQFQNTIKPYTVDFRYSVWSR